MAAPQQGGRGDEDDRQQRMRVGTRRAGGQPVHPEVTGDVIGIDRHGGDERWDHYPWPPEAATEDPQDEQHGEEVRRLIERTARDERVARPLVEPVGGDEYE